MQSALAHMHACLSAQLPPDVVTVLVAHARDYVARILGICTGASAAYECTCVCGNCPLLGMFRPTSPCDNITCLVESANVPNIAHSFGPGLQEPLCGGYIAFARLCLVQKNILDLPDYRTMVLAKFVLGDLIGYND